MYSIHQWIEDSNLNEKGRTLQTEWWNFYLNRAQNREVTEFQLLQNLHSCLYMKLNESINYGQCHCLTVLHSFYTEFSNINSNFLANNNVKNLPNLSLKVWKVIITQIIILWYIIIRHSHAFILISISKMNFEPNQFDVCIICLPFLFKWT